MYIFHPILHLPALDGEVWKPVTEKSVRDIIDGYFVSNYGRICSVVRVKGTEARILMPYSDINGYLHVSFCRKRKRPTVCPPMHRVEMIEFSPVCGYENLQVNHIDGNKHNNYIRNLEWCTRSENMQHASRMGLMRQKIGEDATNSTITNEQAEEIGRLIKEQNLTNIEIANLLGVDYHVVSDISEGNAWKHIYQKYDLGNKKKLTAKSPFSFDQIDKICGYFQNNHFRFKNRTELFDNTLQDLFGIRYDKHNLSHKGVLSGIYRRVYYKDIVDRYNWPINY